MADKLVDMAYSKAELKAEKKGMCVGIDGQPNPYPWGLSIRLEGKELDKLGMKTLPEVGSEMTCEIRCKVTGVTQSAREGQDEERTVAMQITAMAMDSDDQETS